MIDKNKFSLDDLNELSEGLGDHILALLDGHRDLWSCQRAEQKINQLLTANKLAPSDVLVNKGLAEGLTIETAFKNAGLSYQLLDRLGS